MITKHVLTQLTRRHGVLETWILVSRPCFESLGLGREALSWYCFLAAKELHPKFVIPSRHYLSTNLVPDAVAAKTAQLQKVSAVPYHTKTIFYNTINVCMYVTCFSI